MAMTSYTDMAMTKNLCHQSYKVSARVSFLWELSPGIADIAMIDHDDNGHD